MKYLNYTLAVILLVGLSMSCVSNRKYQDEVTARSAAMTRALQAEKKQKEEQDARIAAEERTKEIQKELDELRKDHKLLSTRYEQQQRLNKDLQDSYDKLLALNEKLRGDATNKRIELTEELSRKEMELQRKEFELDKKQREMKDIAARLDKEREELNKLREELAGKNTSISDLEKNKSELEKNLQEREAKVKKLEENLAAREKRVKELEDAIAARDAKNEALRKKINEALLGFKSSDLKVEKRNGKIYVSLSQNLLFATGSSKLDSKGADAISKLGEVLKKNADINVLVEGHTDSDGKAKMNWELSTERSLSIVQELLKSDIDPKRITAAGRGEHAPVATNMTEDGKAKNRRTEIILSPKLDEIMGLIEK